MVRQKKLMLAYKPLMEWLLKRADAIIVATEGHIEGSSYLKAYREKCYIIPFGVKKDVIEGGDRYLQKKALDSPKSEESPCKLLFIGRLVYYKGCDVLLEAMAKTKGTVLNIVGDGPLKKELEEQCGSWRTVMCLFCRLWQKARLLELSRLKQWPMESR